jgi:hypothetical protein
VSDIVWEEPPTPVRRGTGRPPVWVHRLAPLRDRPGEWANLGTHAAIYAGRINRGLLPGIDPGEFQATARNVNQTPGKGHGQATLFVRYVGSGDAGAHRPNREAVGQ